MLYRLDLTFIANSTQETTPKKLIHKIETCEKVVRHKNNKMKEKRSTRESLVFLSGGSRP